jgi:hypothetical protein
MKQVCVDKFLHMMRIKKIGVVIENKDGEMILPFPTPEKYDMHILHKKQKIILSPKKVNQQTLKRNLYLVSQ